MATLRENLKVGNDLLRERLGLMRQITNEQPTRGRTQVEDNLEEELRRRRLTTNEDK